MMSVYDAGIENPENHLRVDKRTDDWFNFAQAVVYGIWALQGSPKIMSDQSIKYLNLAALTAFRRGVWFGLPDKDDFDTKVEKTIEVVFRKSLNDGCQWPEQQNYVNDEI
jgi:hypothetical protein